MAPSLTSSSRWFSMAMARMRVVLVVRDRIRLAAKIELAIDRLGGDIDDHELARGSGEASGGIDGDIGLAADNGHGSRLAVHMP